jgi:hypothetical protein
MLDLLFMKGFYGKLILDKIEKLQNVALIGINSKRKNQFYRENPNTLLTHSNHVQPLWKMFN